MYQLVLFLLMGLVGLSYTNNSLEAEIISNKENKDLTIETENTKSETKDFYMLTIPKSGSHLMLKTLLMLTDRTQKGCSVKEKESQELFNKRMLNAKENKDFIWTHSYYIVNNRMWNFNIDYPEYTKILLVRDLRDILVSLVYWTNREFPTQDFKDFDEALTALLNISSGYQNSERIVGSLTGSIEGMIDWMKQDNIVYIKFEDLIGLAGGGDDMKQRAVITELASALEVPLTEERLEEITRNLFGNENGPNVSITFRSGKIGSWREHFKPHHIQLFNKNWGHYQTALGYSIED